MSEQFPFNTYPYPERLCEIVEIELKTLAELWVSSLLNDPGLILQVPYLQLGVRVEGVLGSLAGEVAGLVELNVESVLGGILAGSDHFNRLLYRAGLGEGQLVGCVDTAAGTREEGGRLQVRSGRVRLVLEGGDGALGLGQGTFNVLFVEGFSAFLHELGCCPFV